MFVGTHNGGAYESIDLTNYTGFVGWSRYILYGMNMLVKDYRKLRGQA